MPTVDQVNYGAVAPVTQDMAGQKDTVSGAAQLGAALNKGEVTPETTQQSSVSKDEEALNPKFAALARREKAIRTEARRIEAERAAIAQERSEVEKYRAWKERLAADPLGVLGEAGITGDQVTQAMLNAPSPEAQKISQLEKRIQELTSSQEETKTKFQQQHEAQLEQAKRQLRTEITLLVDGNESFEAVKAAGNQAQDAIVQLIVDTFQEDGELLSVEEATREVEEHLIEQALTYARLKKVQSKLTPPEARPSAQAQKSQDPLEQRQQQYQQQPTLSNRATPSLTKPLTDNERRQRAILAFEGKL